MRKKLYFAFLLILVVAATCYSLSRYRKGLLDKARIAIETNDIIALKSALRGIKDVNVEFESGQTLLHVAARYNTEAVNLLIEKGAKVDKKDIKGSTPLHIAAYYNHDKPGVCIELLASGAPINEPDNVSRTPLLLAVSRKNSAVAHILIRYKANCNVETGMPSPLGLAASMGDLTLVESLINAGAKIDAKCNNITPLQLAVVCSHYDVARLLVERGADPFIINGEDGQTLLHYAASRGDVEFAAFLIQKGLDIHSVDKHGSTPLHVAIMRKDEQMVINLIDAGASLEKVNKRGDTVLHLAAYKGDLNLVKLFLEKGVDSTIKNIEGKTPVDMTADPEIKKLLSTK